MLKSYADESSTTGFPRLTVSGYLMTADQSTALDLNWRAALGPLPYFHMCEGHHKSHPKVYRDLLNCLTPQSVRAGFSISVNEPYCAKILRATMGNQALKYWFGGPYTLCVGAYMELVGQWVERKMPDELYVAYLFDAGHPRQGEADMFTRMMSSDPFFEETKRERRYGSHTFLDAKSEIGKVLQAGDILAWHLNAYDRTNKICQELHYLWEIPTFFKDYDRKGIEETVFEQVRTHEEYKRAKASGRLRGKRRA